MTKVSVKNQTSHHNGGFWFHITWEENGHRGTDQHGTVWYDKKAPTCSHPSIPTLCKTAHEIITKTMEGVL